MQRDNRSTSEPVSKAKVVTFQSPLTKKKSSEDYNQLAFVEVVYEHSSELENLDNPDGPVKTSRDRDGELANSNKKKASHQDSRGGSPKTRHSKSEGRSGTNKNRGERRRQSSTSNRHVNRTGYNNKKYADTPSYTSSEADTPRASFESMDGRSTSFDGTSYDSMDSNHNSLDSEYAHAVRLATRSKPPPSSSFEGLTPPRTSLEAFDNGYWDTRVILFFW